MHPSPAAFVSIRPAYSLIGYTWTYNNGPRRGCNLSAGLTATTDLGVALATTKRTCSIEGCEKPHRARGYCATHYTRWAKNGADGIEKPLKSLGAPIATRLLKSHLKLDNGCWQWTGATNREGYGIISVNNTGRLAHRISYEEQVGPIPHGLTLDHLCRNVQCINPEHLEPVAAGVNAMRGEGPAAQNARKTHCPKGHGYTPANTYIQKQGWRVCRECHRMRYRSE
ncbi:HNH endonuclease signature motif containing protein [Citricoccus sp. NR2]|uniref:HNH endonuclease signature motif containing protein n=1 Tax=Citricoccus sp. NR2 TaxID=3004095 RepID=UPI003FA40794